MTLEAGKKMDRRCVINWLNEVYVTPSRAFSEYTDDELKMFAYDALVLLKEQENALYELGQLLKERAEEIERLKTPTAGDNHIPLRR